METLKKLRKSKGLTQAELGKILGVSPSTIGMYEQGRRTPDKDALIAISNYFNVSTDYLLCVDNSATISVAGLTEKDIQLIHTMVSHLKEKNEL